MWFFAILALIAEAVAVAATTDKDSDDPPTAAS
jgi:hypothetical protein